MLITKKNYAYLGFAAVVGLLAWLQLTYPRFAFVDLSVSRPQARRIARTFLEGEIGADLDGYRSAVIFVSDSAADRYLQRAIGHTATQQFLKKYDYEYFYWKVRFFKENEQEEYLVNVSAATGEITNFSHVLPDSVVRPDQDEVMAREKMEAFLTRRFGFRADEYIPHDNSAKKLDNRVDYYFSWEHRGVAIPWDEQPDSGTAKILIGAQISGDEILGFNKRSLLIPKAFARDMERRLTVGRNLAVIFRILYLGLLTSAIFYVVVRRNDLVMHTTKNFCVQLTAVIFLLNFLVFFNEFESVLYRYPTTSSFLTYLWRVGTQKLFDSFIVTIGILMPCLAGESLHYEVFPERKEGAFLHYLRSTFFSREIARAVGVGYLAAVILLGMQSVAVDLGERYLGVWVEYLWMARLSASYLPFLSALTLGFVASTTEEISFRLFSISLGRKFLKRTLLAVVLSSLLWGYGHSTYMVFPMWFRGLEVTILGLFLSYIYLRFGIIPVLVAHFLFDAFWCSSPYLLGRSSPYYFYSSLAVILVPAVYALVSFLVNRQEQERPLSWRLNVHQVFNLEILRDFLRRHPPDPAKSLSEVRKEIMGHGWDLAVVELATEDLGQKQSS